MESTIQIVDATLELLHRKIQSLALAVTFVSWATGCSVVSELRTATATGEVQLPQFPEFEGVKRSVAVLDFENTSRFGDDKVGSAMSDMIVAALVRSGRFRVMERAALEDILREQSLGQAGVLTEESAAKSAELLGVNGLVVGSITDIRLGHGTREIEPDEEDWALAVQASVARVSANFRLVHPTTGEVVMADRVKSMKFRPGLGIRTSEWEASDLHDFDQTLLGKAFREAAHKIVSTLVGHVEDLEWHGKVVKLVAAGDSLYFTPGQSAGIRLADRFDVYSRGEPSDDFEDESGPIATIRVCGFVGDRVCTAIVEQGEGIRVGDRVMEITGTNRHALN